MASRPNLSRMPSMAFSSFSSLSRRGAAPAANRSSCSPASPSSTRAWAVRVRARTGAFSLQAARMSSIATSDSSRAT